MYFTSNNQANKQKIGGTQVAIELFLHGGSKKMGGCDYFLWYEDRHPPQANRVMWGLLKKVNAFDE
ncbi:hypothetical protein H5410_012738 [Solanum commersonii]|uniref:Uncharacterized protein n=1 Tax=Solanum commersonii TaxID=4109 RepID=A0A9J6ASG3_SOLCO|nr:hypothetical protein H5410_012738 [Solanum commersonii]